MARAVREASMRRTVTGPWLGGWGWVGCGRAGVVAWIWRSSGRKRQEQRKRGQGMRKEKALPEGPFLERGDADCIGPCSQTGGWAKVQSSSLKPQGASRASPAPLLAVC